MTNASYVIGQNLIAIFVTSGAAARAQPRLALEVMSAYNRLALHHGKMMRRLNGATISALKRGIYALEERRKGVEDLGDYLTEVALPALQVEENVYSLLDVSDPLRLEEYQVSQLHQMLGRVKTLLEWKCPQD